MRDISLISDNQAEAGVIATLIQHPDFVLYTDYLRGTYFYNPENGCIYWAIRELQHNGVGTIDAVNLMNMLSSNPSVLRRVERFNLSNWLCLIIKNFAKNIDKKSIQLIHIYNLNVN